MKNLQNIYSKYKKNTFSFESEYLQKLKKNLIQDFDLDPKVLKNNESIKHFDSRIFNTFDYNPINQYNLCKVINNNDHSIVNIRDNKELFLKKIKKYENSFKNDYLVNLNTIFHNSGIYLEIKDNTNEKYIIENIASKDMTIFSKNFFQVKQNSNVMIVEKFNNEQKSNINLVNYFEIEKNSSVIHLVLQEVNEGANLQFTNYINCYENSYYKQIIYNSSESSIRNHSYANLLEKESKSELFGVFFGKSDQIIDNKTVINHYAPNCVSNQKYKGVLGDKAKASYLSKTYVDKVAQKTEAYQLNKGILLSEDSNYHSKPELKIYADDVKCSHGSTIGPFDQDILFYFRSRGISKTHATALLIKSFFSDIIESANEGWWDTDERLFSTLVKESIDEWLQKNNQ